MEKRMMWGMKRKEKVKSAVNFRSARNNFFSY